VGVSSTFETGSCRCAITTSLAQNDSGDFELSFRDERDQSLLAEIGYSVGRADDQFNTRTARAVRHFRVHFEGRNDNDTVNAPTAALIHAVREANPQADRAGSPVKSGARRAPTAVPARHDCGEPTSPGGYKWPLISIPSQSVRDAWNQRAGGGCKRSSSRQLFFCPP
jgi:hypothetical protein